MTSSVAWLLSEIPGLHELLSPTANGAGRSAEPFSESGILREAAALHHM